MDAATGLTYMQQRYYDPQVGRFLSVDPMAVNTNSAGNFNRFNYAANNPYRFSDPDGRKCSTVEGKENCTFDEFKDKQGRTITRDQALASGSKLAKLLGTNRGSKILKAEASMTAKYSAAKAVAARGGEVTIKGNQTLGIPDQKVSGAAIVDRMQTITSIAAAGPSSEDSPGLVFHGGVPMTTDGSPSDGPITYWSDGAGVDAGRMFGHEILHTLYSGVGVPNGGWANPDNNEMHQVPFEEASDAIQ
jgi:RHS repeat-associated protein